MERGRTISTLAQRFTAPVGDIAAQPVSGPEEVLVEEPLEIRLGDEVVATTMRTPGHDFELAVGFLRAEGLISSAPARVRHCEKGTAADSGFNVVTVEPSAADKGPVGAVVGEARARLGLMSSSCGICGAQQIHELVARLEPLPATAGLGIADLVAANAGVGKQELFELTGGSHAAAAFDLHGSRLEVTEDIGRHNAVDKLVGRLLLADSLPVAGDPERALVLWVSGRASFEIVQKAWAAGFSALVAVGAVSALAVETAGHAGLVLGGFARADRVTVYACGDRLAPREVAAP